MALASPHTLVTLSTHSPYTLLKRSSHSSHTPLLIACASCLPSVQVMRALMISKWQALGSKKGPEKGIAAARKMANTWMSKVLGRELQVCVCVCVCVRLWATSCRAHLTLASWWLVRARKLQARCRTVAHEMPLIFRCCNSTFFHATHLLWPMPCRRRRRMTEQACMEEQARPACQKRTPKF